MQEICNLQKSAQIRFRAPEFMKPKLHKIKSWTMFFMDIITGNRTSDIRKTTDRHFAVGDYMLLQEFDPVKQEYTGREQLVEITYIQQNKSNPCAISHDAIRDDHAVLSIQCRPGAGGGIEVAVPEA